MKIQILSELKMKYFALATAIAAVLVGILVVMPSYAHAQISTNARNLAGLIAVDRITGDGGFGGDTTSLGDLIVLNGLFDSTTSTGSARDLASLIAVDRIVGDDGGFTSGDTSLGDLIVLNNLFGTGGTTSTSARNLAGLIAVDRITGDGVGDSTSLGDLIVLNGIFDP